MNFVKFESATEKERIRNEIRIAREELLARAKKDAELRAERQAAKKLKGEDSWLLPDLKNKFKKIHEKNEKLNKKKIKEKHKSKKSKKEIKKKKKKRKYSKSSSSSESSGTEEEILKKKRKKKQKLSSDSESSSSSSSSSSNSDDEEEWVEKPSAEILKSTTTASATTTNTNLMRDEWMTEGQLFLKTFQKEVNTEKKDKKQIDSYDPSKSSRELNPHWKYGGKGLPSFQKPKDDDDYDNGYDDRRSKNYFSSSTKYSGNWRKNEVSSTRTSRDYEREDPRKKIQDNKHDRRESSKSRRNRSRSRESESSSKRRSRSKESESRSTRRQSRSKSKDPESKSNKRQSRSKSKESNSDSSRNNSPQKSQNSKANDGNDDSFLTDEQMNQLGAKLIKAEIMGNDELAKELKEKLEKAREIRKNIKNKPKIPQQKQQQRKQDLPSTSKTKDKNSVKEEHILLTTTNSKGMTKPLSSSSSSSHHPFSHDPWGGRKANKRKQKTETHIDGERVRYFPDDDRYDIKQMFEREKYTTAHDSDAQFIEIAGKHKERSKDDLDDIFADKVRESISDYDQNKKEIKRAINEHEQYTKILESCDKCFDSLKMNKSHMIAMGNNVYLSIPYEQGLQTGHCCIIPMQHITCSTQLDEDTWNEINEFRKSLTRMFYEQKSQDVIFFEIANYLHKKPHMIIHCIPSDNFELAPMYFKKAIQESEYEWSTNKQLITLKDKDLRRSIPKGLPYFWVNFGMNLGFAHVIEDQHKFKPNFAQEIIGGMLNLDTKRWRKPKKEHHYIEKVKKFAEMWKPYDLTS